MSKKRRSPSSIGSRFPIRPTRTFVNTSRPSRDHAFRLRTLSGTRTTRSPSAAPCGTTSRSPRTSIGDTTALANTFAEAISPSIACLRTVLVSRSARTNAPAARIAADAPKNTPSSVTRRPMPPITERRLIIPVSTKSPPTYRSQTRCAIVAAVIIHTTDLTHAGGSRAHWRTARVRWCGSQRRAASVSRRRRRDKNGSRTRRLGLFELEEPWVLVVSPEHAADPCACRPSNC